MQISYFHNIKKREKSQKISVTAIIYKIGISSFSYNPFPHFRYEVYGNIFHLTLSQIQEGKQKILDQEFTLSHLYTKRVMAVSVLWRLWNA